MSDHDPLCPMVQLGEHPICVCGVIGKVRADERERIAQMFDANPMRDEFSAALDARYRTISDREDMDLDAHADWVAEWFAKVRAEERARIAQAIREARELMTDGDRPRRYLDGLADGFTLSERIARNGGQGA